MTEEEKEAGVDIELPFKYKNGEVVWPKKDEFGEWAEIKWDINDNTARMLHDYKYRMKPKNFSNE